MTTAKFRDSLNWRVIGVYCTGSNAKNQHRRRWVATFDRDEPGQLTSGSNDGEWSVRPAHTAKQRREIQAKEAARAERAPTKVGDFVRELDADRWFTNMSPQGERTPLTVLEDGRPTQFKTEGIAEAIQGMQGLMHNRMPTAEMVAAAHPFPAGPRSSDPEIHGNVALRCKKCGSGRGGRRTERLWPVLDLIADGSELIRVDVSVLELWALIDECDTRGLT